MGFFNDLMRTGKSLGSEVGSAIGRAASRTSTSAKTAAKISALKMELNSIESEFEHLYMIVGKKYVEYLIETDDEPAIDLTEEFRAIIPRRQRKEEIENEINELEAANMQSNAMEDLHDAKQEYYEQKRKLDKALTMGVITQDEYDEKLEKYQSKVENFREINRLKQQYDMGIITKDELKFKLKALGVRE